MATKTKARNEPEPIKVYEYKGCATCRKALKYLDSKEIDYERIPIRETPPIKDELKKMVREVGDVKRLFNTAGHDYREMGLKDKWRHMAPDDVYGLLASNGNLVKRPFVISEEVALVGFKVDEWDKAFG